MTKTPSILMSTSMVKATISGRKTQARTIVKLPKEPGEWESLFLTAEDGFYASGDIHPGMQCVWNTTTGNTLTCPYGIPGNLIYVKETFIRDKDKVIYRADGNNQYISSTGVNWIDPIHMKIEESRILLEIMDVRVERLNQISNNDAMSEGIDFEGYIWDDAPKNKYKELWKSIKGNNWWNKNQRSLVWVIEFRNINID